MSLPFADFRAVARFFTASILAGSVYICVKSRSVKLLPDGGS